MRTFIAIELDERTREAIAGLVRRLAGASDGARWVRPENIHVTIKFLGETSPDTIPLVEQAMRDIAREIAPFQVILDKLGAFPNLRRPRVVWMGIGAGKEELKLIYSLIEKKLRSMGIPAEGRAYTPHITIGRFKRQAKNTQLASIFRDSRVNAGFMVTRITFIESKLTPKGPQYRTIHAAPLKGSPAQISE